MSRPGERRRAGAFLHRGFGGLLQALQQPGQAGALPGRQGDDEGIVDRDIFAKAGASGFLAMSVPEQYGGAGVDDFRYNQIIAEELAVLVNDQDPQSLAVADYYQKARQIPPGNIITLSFPPANTLSAADFTALKAEIDVALAAGPLPVAAAIDEFLGVAVAKPADESAEAPSK